VALVIAYCMGLGIPFLALAVGSGWAVGAFDWLRRNTRAIQVLGGVLLIVVGLALVTGAWNEFISWIRDGFVSDVRLPI
jgi:cytochrome c-type biogenesis protein